jgi:hypothetical protein
MCGIFCAFGPSIHERGPVARLEEEAAQAAQGAKEHLAQRAVEEAASGKKKRGRKPKPMGPTPGTEAKANVTDPESRIMKDRHGYLRGYNPDSSGRSARAR